MEHSELLRKEKSAWGNIDESTQAAREIVTCERRIREEKTRRLREARLKKECSGACEKG